MDRLTDEMQTMFRDQLAVVATASKTGIPNVVPKGPMYVFDDETLIYSEGRGEKTLKNLQENPKVAAVVLDKDKINGYQVKGTAELITGGNLFLDIAERQKKRNHPQPKYVVKIKVEEIYLI
jgi:predicted pyridoxine 5'-phosphate oxidase superfamily flavin-nucleotide-binding protein